MENSESTESGSFSEFQEGVSGEFVREEEEGHSSIDPSNRLSGFVMEIVDKTLPSLSSEHKTTLAKTIVDPLTNTISNQPLSKVGKIVGGGILAVSIAADYYTMSKTNKG